MGQLRFVNTCQAIDTQDIETVKAKQDARRKEVETGIVNMCKKSRQNINECISKVLTALREQIVSEITLDEERKKNNPVQNSNAVSMKKKDGSNNVCEKLNFPSGMTYGHRSNLRKQCAKFLRFAYLVDFLSL